MQNPEIQSLADRLCRQAGLISRWGQASPQMIALMQLSAGRCLDVLARAKAETTCYAEIARMFGAAGALDTLSENVACRAELEGAPGLTNRQRNLAEEVFAEALRQKLGGAFAVFKNHGAWSEDPGSDAGRRWAGASALAARLVDDRLAAEGATAGTVNPASGARFKIRFIHELS